MSDAPSSTRIVVIGGGPGGYPAAFLAAERGMDVTLIDKEPNPGGVCLYRGCIPSKALLHAAHLIDDARGAAEMGVRFDAPTIDLEKLRKHKESVVSKMVRGLGSLAKQRQVRYIQGTARFEDARSIVVDVADGEEERLSFDYAIVATGSRPATVKSLDIGSPKIMDSTSALELEEIPQRLLVVGGGYIGLELGSVYASLGSRVTVVEMTSSLLPGVDHDLVEPLERRLKKQFEAILLDTRVVSVEDEDDNGLNVKLSGLPSGSSDRHFSRMLVAAGRRPNTESVGLERTAVEIDDHGFVVVDEQRRTGEPSIFAVGDVAGEPMLAHKATHEARVAVDAIAGEPSAWEPAAIPAVVFTDPEIAWAGLTETECLTLGIDHEVTRFPWSASGRAATLGRSDGVTKLILEPRTERILGVGITGPGAGELISEGVLAIEMGTVARDLQLTIHPHPTLSETLMEAADLLYGTSPHYIARARRKR